MINIKMNSNTITTIELSLIYLIQARVTGNLYAKENTLFKMINNLVDVNDFTKPCRN